MNKNQTKHDWMTIQDFEDEFQVSVQLQASWRHKKRLPYSRIGNTVRYQRSKIDKFFKDAEVKK